MVKFIETLNLCCFVKCGTAFGDYFAGKLCELGKNPAALSFRWAAAVRFRNQTKFDILK
jgi:hypothetical protein